MLQCPAIVAFFICFQGAGHQEMIARAGWFLGQRRGEMTPSGLAFSTLQQNLRQVELSFFGYLRGKMAEAGETLEEDQGILLTSQPLEIAAPGQQTINQIERLAHVERLAHGAASLQAKLSSLSVAP